MTTLCDPKQADRPTVSAFTAIRAAGKCWLTAHSGIGIRGSFAMIPGDPAAWRFILLSDAGD
jgi:hypothetical protein